MSHFYLTLPSNASMEIYPNNTVAKYTTKLPTSIELDGEWEVALTEIMYNNKWANISGEWLRYYEGGSWSQKYNLPNGVYTHKSLTEKVRELLTEAGDKCGLVQLKQHHFSVDDIDIINEGRPVRGFDMSPRLALILGLQDYDVLKQDRSCYNSYTFLGTTPKPLLKPSLTSLFVYCDILEHVPVGDTLAPLLRCVNIEGESGKRVGATFTFPMYIPVQKKVFDSVEINIMTETGDPAPFVDGPSTVTLHFRRTRNPYFLSK
jgi:hypothetical protein